MDSTEAFDVTVKHNLQGLKYCNTRIDLLLRPLSVIEKLDKDSKILIIGPRNENDLFTLVGYGFNFRNLTGLDLISYSPTIEIGDMHHTRFPDNHWDAVVCGWTLSYSSEPAKAIHEIVRITKNGGLVALGVEYSTLTEEDYKDLIGYSIQDFSKLKRRVNSVQDILSLFGESIGTIYFQHDAPLKRSHTKNVLLTDVSNVAVILSIKKPESQSNESA